MKKKYRLVATLVLITGLVVGWNLQNKQVVNALLGTNTLVSRNSSGTRGNGDSFNSDISLDGRYVVFSSLASNLVTGDTNGAWDIFLKDTFTNAVTRISVNSSGTEGNGNSWTVKITGNGKYVVYTTDATNLIAGDTNSHRDILRYNVTSGVTDLVSVSSGGTQGNLDSYDPSVDAEGRFISFTTNSTNLGTTDTNGDEDVVLKDMNSGAVTYLNQSDAGVFGNGAANTGKISCDGRFVLFTSNSSNLVSGDTNGASDAFVTDMLGTRTVTNVTSGASSWSKSNDISCDGKYILYTSDDSGQVSGDTNGTYDVFRYNRSTGTKDMVSLKENGSAPTQQSEGVAISADGKYAIFFSSTSSFFTSTADNNSSAYNSSDLFFRDMSNSNVRVIDVNSSLTTPTDGTYGASFSGGNRIVYESKGSGLVSDDNQGYIDTFIVDLGPANTCIVQ